MDNAAPTDGADTIGHYQLNALGQAPILQAYGQIVLVFELPPGQTHGDTVGHLRSAAERLYALFPQLAGVVVNPTRTESDRGVFCIAPRSADEEPPTLLVKDMSESCPSFQELRDAKGSMRLFPHEGLSSKKCMPFSYEGTDETQPVLVLQANLISGGLILTISLQHQAGDGTGFGWIIRHLSTLMCGGEVSKAHVAAAFPRDMVDLPTLRAAEDPARTYFTGIPMSDEEAASRAAAPPAMTWACFRVTAASLRQLKVEASMKEGESTETGWVSSNDALLAFLWQRISVVRMACGAQADTPTHSARAVDMRSRMGTPVPEGYMSNFALVSATSALSIGEVASMPLARLSTFLRRRVHEMDGRMLRTVVSNWLANESPYADASVRARHRDYDLMMSSWTALGVQQVVFGPLGKPTLARREGKTPFPSWSYVMPPYDNGDVDLQLCFRAEHMAGLIRDEAWSARVEYIG